MLMPAAFWTTRARILRRSSLRVANSARARRAAGDGVAQGEHQPVSGGVQNQPELVGERSLAGGPIRGELPPVQPDQVLGLTSGTIDVFVEIAGIAAERSDDTSSIEVAGAHLQPDNDPTSTAPGAGRIGEGGEAAHSVCADLGAADPDVVGHLEGESVQYPIARIPEDVIHAVLLTPGHCCSIGELRRLCAGTWQEPGS